MGKVQNENVNKFEEKYVNSNGRINEEKLFSFIYNKPVQQGTKSVLRPSALPYILCSDSISIAGQLKHVGIVYNKLIGQNHILGKVIELQLFYGLRISEVLSIDSTAINQLGQICIKGLKGSNDRIITPVQTLDFYLKCRKSGLAPFSYLSRYYVYRQYKKMGIESQLGKDGKKMVTHLMRHLIIKSNKAEGYDMETIQQFIGHKSIKSTEHYGK